MVKKAINLYLTYEDVKVLQDAGVNVSREVDSFLRVRAESYLREKGKRKGVKR